MSKKEYDDEFWSQYEDIDEAQVDETTPLFKLKEKGETTRIYFPLVKPSTGKIVMKKVKIFNFSDPNTKNWARFQAPEDMESEAYQIAVKYCGEPTVSYATPILKYFTNSQGRVVSGEEYSISVLKITPSRLSALKTLQAQDNLNERDVMVSLEEAKYQKMNFHILKDCGLKDGEILQVDSKGNKRQTKIDIDLKEVVEESLQILESSDLSLAQRWTEKQIVDYFTRDSDYDSDDDYEEDAEEDTPQRSVKHSHKVKKRTSDEEFDDEIEDDE